MHPEINEEQLILGISEFSLQLASSGLALHEETADGQTPRWHDWAIMSAKRRTILTIYMLTWAWSVLRNYPSFYCHELQLMFAPSPKALWQAQTEPEWLSLYQKWHQRWNGDGYRIGELLSISPNQMIDRRTEDWLEEVDEFGMLLMSQGKSALNLGANKSSQNSSECYLIGNPFKGGKMVCDTLFPVEYTTGRSWVNTSFRDGYPKSLQETVLASWEKRGYRKLD